jgi:hypothetical protein
MRSRHPARFNNEWDIAAACVGARSAPEHVRSINWLLIFP